MLEHPSVCCFTGIESLNNKTGLFLPKIATPHPVYPSIQSDFSIIFCAQNSFTLVSVCIKNLKRALCLVKNALETHSKIH